MSGPDPQPRPGPAPTPDDPGDRAPGSPAARALAFARWLTARDNFWSIATMILLLGYNLVAYPQFFSVSVLDGHLYGSLIDILNHAAPLMIIAMGLTLVIATHGIDISVGAVVAISGAVAAALIGGDQVMSGSTEDVTQLGLALVIAIALGVALLCGMWNGALVSMLGMQPIVATLILLGAGRGVAQLITKGQIITIYYSPYFYIGNGFLLGVPFSLFIVAVVAAIMLLLTRKTALGLFIEAIGVNPVASRLSGIRARSITFAVYAVCGLCAGIAGLIVSSNVKSADGNNAGLLFELDAILAVVLGGTSLAGGKFFLLGSLLGAVFIQTLTTTIYNTGVAPEITLVVKGLVVLVVSILQSDRMKTLIGAAAQRRGRPAR
jgi:simple sugar transport system permease protein